MRLRDWIGFDAECVEGRGSDMPVVEQIAQRSFIEEPITRRVHDYDALLDSVQPLGREGVPGFIREGYVQGDDVGAREEFIKLDLLHAQLHSSLRSQKRIMRDDTHLEPQRAIGDDRTDVAATDQAERLVVLSTPVPARPITFRFLAAAITFSVHCVADRTTRPSYSPTMVRSSSFVQPGFVSTSIPRLSKTSTAARDSSSLIRTLGTF